MIKKVERLKVELILMEMSISCIRNVTLEIV
jgi:hypothetical protein